MTVPTATRLVPTVIPVYSPVCSQKNLVVTALRA